MKAMDVLPKEIKQNARFIETRLRLSGVKFIEMLDQDKVDDRSSRVERDFADSDGEDEIRGQHFDDEEEEAAKDAAMKAAEEAIDSEIAREEERQAGRSLSVSVSVDSEDEATDIFTAEDASMAFTHDTDNLVAEHLQEGHSVQSALSLKEELNSIRSTLNATEERIIEWVWSAKKETQLSAPQACLLGCGGLFSIEMMTEHLRTICPNRSSRCFKCELLVKERMMKVHERKLCAKRIVACPNASKGCKQLFPFDYKDIHVNLKCKVRPMCCRQFCEVILPLYMREEHEVYHCKNRVMSCDACHEEMIAHEYSAHLLHSCAERIVHCKFACGRTFKAKDVAHHELHECVQPCKWNCGSIIGPAEKLRLHEVAECAKRPSECRYHCHSRHLTAGTVLEHEGHQCLLRPVLCPFGCGETLQQRDVSLHCESWSGNCPQRLVRCPSNLVGWRILLLPDYLTEGIVLQYKREKELTGQQNKSSFYGVDQLCVKFPDEVRWIDYWTSDVVLVGKLAGSNEGNEDEFDCGWITCADMNLHLNSACIHRNVFVKGRAEDLRPHRGVAAEASAEAFAGHRVPFKEVLSAAERLHEFDEFLHREENPPTISCGFCSAQMLKVDLDFHKKNDCPYSLVRCPYGCGKENERRLLKVRVAVLHMRSRSILLPLFLSFPC